MDKFIIRSIKDKSKKMNNTTIITLYLNSSRKFNTVAVLGFGNWVGQFRVMIICMRTVKLRGKQGLKKGLHFQICIIVPSKTVKQPWTKALGSNTLKN